ncbi:MAG: sigma-70 family RNA polymerase sigma factor [Pirellulales bacterium]
MVEQSRFSELIARVRNRDEEAAQELATHYQDAIRRAIRIQLRDAGMRRVLDSMDICQSVLASFFVRTALGQYDLESPDQLLRLLTTIARNKLTNQINKAMAQRRDLRREVAFDENVNVVRDQQSDPAEQVSAQEILLIVREKLSPEERYIAEQREQGRPWSELAAELSSNEDAIRKKLSRAWDRVMEQLGLESYESNR